MNTNWLTYKLGAQAFETRDYNAAVDHFVRVLEEHPNDTNTREYLARAYYARASLPLAEKEARTILDQNPTDEYAALLLARCLERQSRHDEAMGVRRQLAALSGNPEHLKGHNAGV